jgi:hypothetical protein
VPQQPQHQSKANGKCIKSATLLTKEWTFEITLEKTKENTRKNEKIIKRPSILC